MTTSAVTSVCGSEWDDDTIGRVAETTTLNDQTYVFGKRQWMIPARKWRAPTSQVYKKGKQSTLDTAGHLQAQIIEGVFMFDSTAQNVSKTKSSLPALYELPSHQELVGNQVKTTKRPSRWSRFGKFRVETKKTQGSDHMGHTTKKRRKTASTPKKINPYELRDQELKIEEGKRAKRKFFNWKRRQQQNPIRKLKC